MTDTWAGVWGLPPVRGRGLCPSSCNGNVAGRCPPYLVQWAGVFPLSPVVGRGVSALHRARAQRQGFPPQLVQQAKVWGLPHAAGRVLKLTQAMHRSAGLPPAMEKGISCPWAGVFLLPSIQGTGGCVLQYLRATLCSTGGAGGCLVLGGASPSPLRMPSRFTGGLFPSFHPQEQRRVSTEAQPAPIGPQRSVFGAPRTLRAPIWGGSVQSYCRNRYVLLLGEGVCSQQELQQ